MVLGRFVNDDAFEGPRLALLEPLQEIGPNAARVEKLLELHRRQLAQLLFGVVDAPLLADARPDLLHDLLDVDRFGPDVEIHKLQLLCSRASSPSALLE